MLRFALLYLDFVVARGIHVSQTHLVLIEKLFLFFIQIHNVMLQEATREREKERQRQLEWEAKHRTTKGKM